MNHTLTNKGTHVYTKYVKLQKLIFHNLLKHISVDKWIEIGDFQWIGRGVRRFIHSDFLLELIFK